MLDPKLAVAVLTRERSLDRARRELQTLSSGILSGSKRAIFALHRDDPRAAEKELVEAGEGLERGWKIVRKEARLTGEGSWCAAREEFTEAELFFAYVRDGRVAAFSDNDQDPDIFIGGISDVVGEMVRRAMLLASRGEGGRVELLYQDASAIVVFLLKMDLTGPLRTKTDQARQHLRKLEEIRYDVEMRSRSY